MKKILIILIGLLVLAIPTAMAFAAATTLAGLATNISNAMYTAGIALVVFGFVLSGIMFLTAAGSPEKLGHAKSALLWSVIGTAVIILSKSAEAIITALT